ncbi:MAG: M28 family peptidase [Bacteroidales bacterium]|nr:M28 family peptidase [Bacteroidales bacterium]
MKKSIALMAFMLVAVFGFSQSFVMINTENQQQTEKLFNNDNLKIHYYNDNFVLATAKVVDESMKVIDSQAFSDNEAYYIVYCGKENQDNYISEINDDNVLFKNDNTLIVNNMVKPFKNDGMIAVFNKEAKMAVAQRDFPVVTEENETIRQMMNQVNMDSLLATVQHLQDYGGRYFNSTEAYAASDWIASKMAALGLEVEQQDFNVSGSWVGSGPSAPNVIGIQRGTLYPDTYVVCGSHFDSFTWDAMSGSNNAPGADDNATGVASVLESARIMTQYEFEYSIIYCAYGAEELGLYGSAAYASRCSQQGMDIIGYFNNDMNGYLNPGDEIHIDLIYPNSVAAIGDYYMNVANVYFPEMQVRHVNFTSGDSDHTSFNNNGYMGIYPFEDYQNYSPNIHTTNDLIGPSVNSFEMSQRYCRMNIGCLAEIANPTGSGPQVYCNPVTDFYIDYLDGKETDTWLYLVWNNPLEGSTGELDHFDVYRDNEVIATVGLEVPDYWEYEYTDTIAVGSLHEYFIMAVYSDGCESPSETLIGYGEDDVPEIDALDDEIVSYEFYDLMGRKVTDLESGIYIVRYTMRNGNVVTEKIIKK